MTISRRDTILAVFVGLVVLAFISWIIPMPSIILMSNSTDVQIQKAVADQNRKLNDDQKLALVLSQKADFEKLINQRSTFQNKLEALRHSLPHYKTDEQVSAQIISGVKKISDEHSLVLSRITAGQETPIGDLSEIALDCSWEGTLEDAMYFLHAVQIQGAMLDIREMQIQPSQTATKPGQLKGTFKIYYAFIREEPPKPVAPPASSNAPPAAATNAALTASAVHAATTAVEKITVTPPGGKPTTSIVPAPPAAPARPAVPVPLPKRGPSP